MICNTESFVCSSLKTFSLFFLSEVSQYLRTWSTTPEFKVLNCRSQARPRQDLVCIISLAGKLPREPNSLYHTLTTAIENVANFLRIFCNLHIMARRHGTKTVAQLFHNVLYFWLEDFVWTFILLGGYSSWHLTCIKYLEYSRLRNQLFFVKK